jgi:fatty acid desaturase
MRINFSARNRWLLLLMNLKSFLVDSYMREHRSAQVFGLSLAVVLVCVLTLTAITY